MKLRNLFPQRFQWRPVRQCGEVRLVRRPGGWCELLSGGDTARAATFEWSALFAHEIVFRDFDKQPLAGGSVQVDLLCPGVELAV